VQSLLVLVKALHLAGGNCDLEEAYCEVADGNENGPVAAVCDAVDILDLLAFLDLRGVVYYVVDEQKFLPCGV